MSRPQVLVVGAGPVGLALALALSRYRVPSVVLDEGDGHPEPRSARSCVLRPDTAALAARLGSASADAPAARWKGWRTHRRRQQVERITFLPEEAAAPTGTTEGESVPAAPRHVSQATLLAELRAAAERSDLVRLVDGARLEALEQDATGVIARTRGARNTPWYGSYLVGCDGYRSTVRKLLTIRFPGRTAVERHVVAALRVELPWPGEALLHREPPLARGPRCGEVTARPLTDGRWRLDWLLPPQGEVVTPQDLMCLIEETLVGWHAKEPPPYELLDTGVHTGHQRIARRWRDGRVFLAGDAAHLLGSLGTQSVDEGLRDVENLAWKLALVWHATAPPSLLDSYEAERRAAVVSRLRAVDQALPLVRGGGGLRSLVPGLRGQLELLRDGHLGRGALGGAPRYGRSPLAVPPEVTTATADTAQGAVVVDVPVIRLTGTRTRLRRCLGNGLLVLLVAPGAGVWDARHWLSAGLMPRLAAVVSSLPGRPELLVTEDYPGCAAHTVLLIRPDGHLAVALPGADAAAELRGCAQVVCGGAPRTAGAEATTGG